MPHGRVLGVKQAVSTLTQLHAELGGKLLDCQQEAERIADRMAKVEAVILMLEPNFMCEASQLANATEPTSISSVGHIQ